MAPQGPVAVHSKKGQGCRESTLLQAKGPWHFWDLTRQNAIALNRPSSKVKSNQQNKQNKTIIGDTKVQICITNQWIRKPKGTIAR